MNSLLETSIPVLGLELAGIPLTPEEFDAVTEYDRDYRYELIRGVLVVTPVPLPAETAMNQRLGTWLEMYASQHPQGKVLDETLPEQIVPTANGRRRPDRVLWLGLNRVPRPEEDLPTIIVEFVSAARRDQLRDYVVKRQEYLAIGVQEYWIIDRFRRIMTVVRATSEEVIGETEIYHPAPLPGFELPLAQLLAVADRHDATNPGDSA